MGELDDSLVYQKNFFIRESIPPYQKEKIFGKSLYYCKVSSVWIPYEFNNQQLLDIIKENGKRILRSNQKITKENLDFSVTTKVSTGVIGLLVSTLLTRQPIFYIFNVYVHLQQHIFFFLASNNNALSHLKIAVMHFWK